MNPVKALDRLAWRFGGGSFTPNENDIKAYNDLAQYVEKQEKKQINNNLLFAKLYIYAYAKLLNHYQTNVFDPIPQKELSKVLKSPIEGLFIRFKDVLNESDMYTHLDSKKFVYGHPLTLDEKTKESNLEKMQNLPKYNSWNLEDVKENLEAQINLVINNS